MHHVVNHIELPGQQDLPLFAQLGNRLGVQWRRIGTVRRVDGSLDARLAPKAFMLQQLWDSRSDTRTQVRRHQESVRFAALVDGRFVHVIGVSTFDARFGIFERRVRLAAARWVKEWRGSDEKSRDRAFR